MGMWSHTHTSLVAKRALNWTRNQLNRLEADVEERSQWKQAISVLYRQVWGDGKSDRGYTCTPPFANLKVGPESRVTL